MTSAASTPSSTVRTRQHLRVLAALLLSALIVLAVSFALRPSGGRAGGRPSLVAAALAAVQTPSATEFPTIQSAIAYLIEQVRTQNVEGATRVMPIAYYYQRATFPWQVARLASLDLQGFFPKQPFSKLYTVLGFIQRNYTLLSVNLLRPNFSQTGVIALPTAVSQQQIEAKLDPSRLARLSIRSSTIVSDSTKVNSMDALGVNRIAEAHAVIAGLPSPRTVDVLLDRYGTNWLIDSINVLTK